jgi:hypothetical protein
MGNDVSKRLSNDDLSYNYVGRLGGVVVSLLATGSKGCGFKTRPKRWTFKGDKNPQHTFLSDGK